MVMGNEHIARPERAHLPNHATIPGVAPDRDDHIVAVGHRPATVMPHRLRADHRAVLRTLVDHLIPFDDGATVHAELVLRHIDWLVANEGAGVDAPLTLADLYRTGCELIQAHASRTYGCPVQAMSDAEQDQLVWDMLESSMDGFERFSPAYFFNTLRRHIADAMEGAAITPN